MATETLDVVSHEQNGRILSGVGASAEDLAQTMDRHTPDEAQVEPKAPAVFEGNTVTSEASQVVAPAVVPEKPQTRGQKRFADLTREREDAKREAAALRAEIEQLKARPASAPATAPVQAPAAAPVATAAPTPTETRPKPSVDDIGPGLKYPDYSDYVEDLADWKYEQRLAAHDIDARIRQSIEADRASRNFTDTVTKVLDAGRKAFPDFDAVRATSDVMLPKSLLDTIFAMKSPEQVIYRLAKDRELATKLATSDPYSAGLLLATIVPTATDAPPASSAQPMVTPPPAPYQPVQGGRQTTVTPSAELAKGFDFDRSGYREQRARERGKVRAR